MARLTAIVRNQGPDDAEIGNQNYLNVGDATKVDLDAGDENDRPPRTFAALAANTPET